jgi:hypothetical protein
MTDEVTLLPTVGAQHRVTTHGRAERADESGVDRVGEGGAWVTVLVAEKEGKGAGTKLSHGGEGNDE